MRDTRALRLFASLLIAVCLGGCGGGGGGPNDAGSAAMANGANNPATGTDQNTSLAPAGLTYANYASVYSAGKTIAANSPSNSGGTVSQYSISPELPTGLVLDSRTGTISGSPEQASTSRIYTVTASNARGSATARVQIEVKAVVTSPETLTYGNTEAIYTTGQSIAPSVPAVTGGQISRFRISPALPAGLVFDPVNGAISGTPTVTTLPIDYTVTGSNEAGAIVAKIRIEVRAPVVAPATLRYLNQEPVYVVGQAIVTNLAATSGGEIKTYSVSPALPGGLSLNAQTGAISGTPSGVQGQASYVITGSNSAGAVHTQLKITVLLVPTGGWEPTGGMQSGRTDHTATLLPDGEVLVAGEIFDEPELYNPSSGTWRETLGGRGSVAGDTATLLPNGKVLLAGKSRLLASVYDPVSRTWTLTSKMQHPRRGATATLLPNGKVLVAGGYSTNERAETTYFAQAELYDPVSDTWTVTGSLNVARTSHVAVPLPGGKVLVAGGSNGSATTGTVEIYDAATGTWTQAASMNAARRGATATLLGDSKILVAGGSNANTAELYDPQTGAWRLTSAMVMPRIGSQAVLLPNGRVLVTGNDERYVGGGSSTEIYDPASGSWLASADMGVARSHHTATLLPDGSVLVAGGQQGSVGSIAVLLLYSAERFRY